jgi:hypothetical protein
MTKIMPVGLTSCAGQAASSTNNHDDLFFFPVTEKGAPG